MMPSFFKTWAFVCCLIILGLSVFLCYCFKCAPQMINQTCLCVETPISRRFLLLAALAWHFRPNESWKHNPKSPPPFNFFFLCTWLPTLTPLRKRHLANFFSYLTTPLNKKSSAYKYLLAKVRSWVFKCLSKNARCAPLATRTPACGQLGASLS
jgi:hypothetical protein